MRVGLNAAKREGLASLDHVTAVFREVLGERHQLVPFPDDYYDVAPARRRKMAHEMVQSCDVILSPPEATLLATRAWLNAPVALCMLMLGMLPRGYFGLRPLVNALHASDVLVVNSRADVEIARAAFENASVRLLPFAYREQLFHPPAAGEAAAMRGRLGIPPRAPVVLYAGRCTIEKNVHTVLKVFRIVRMAVPDAHLVLAGPLENVRFAEFGVGPLHMAHVVQRVRRALGLGDGVHLPGALGPDDLRAMYGAADVVVNLTLNHDENFGLAPVEAMACGTPVVGTRWGGLQDTIAHGEAGYHVSTAVTAHGVKSSWWEAANRVVQLLGDAELRASFGRRGVEIARERFSPARHGLLLESILEDAVHATRRLREPLRVSAFTRELWEAHRPDAEHLPPARRGPAAYALYRRLIAPYAGTAEGGVDADRPLSAGQVVFLANPVAWSPDGTLAVNDAQFPWDVQVPPEVGHAVRIAVEWLAREPVTTAGALMERMERPDRAGEALAWMLEAGLVMRAGPGLDALDAALAFTAALTPLVSIRRVEHPADIVYVA
jgi:glycosyltransferase involved in cell wall biosynthesis